METRIRKAVIPVAGFGTRFLPVVKTVPKEMLPILNKPTLQYIVEELVRAGIETIIFVSGIYKKAIEDYFDYHFELEEILKKGGKEKELKEVRRLAEMANFIFVRQKVMRGNGDAILCAREAVGNEPFIVSWGDSFTESKSSEFKELIKAFGKYKSPILAGYKTEKEEDTYKYGYVEGKYLGNGITEVKSIVEKPGPEKAPSNIAMPSGFLFTPDIFEALEKVKIPQGEELVYVDGVSYLLEQGKKVYAKTIKGSIYHDCGNVLDWLKVNVHFALKDPEIKDEFGRYLKERIE